MRPSFKYLGKDHLMQTTPGTMKTPSQFNAWDTPESIAVKPEFSSRDIENADHLHFIAGHPPYLQPLKNPIFSTGKIWLRVRKDYPLLSIWRPIEVMIRTTPGWREMLGRPGWPSIPFLI
jgi:hypothetical protein